MATGQSTAFGALLRRYRLLAGLTQEQLAERAGLSARAITALERGVNRTPQRDTFRLLADALELGPDERAALEATTRRPRAPLVADPVAIQHGSQPLRAPIVGRAQEVAQVERHVNGAGPPLLLFSGEPGIGKSRLLQEAMRLAHARGMTILEGGCHWNTCQEPYAPVIGSLEHYLAHASSAQCRADLRGCAWLTRLLPELEEIIGAPSSSWPLTPEQERRLTFGAVARFLANISGAAGTLLVVDDLHWIGPDLRDLLMHLLRAAPDIHLRIIAAYRDTDVNFPPPLAATIINLVRNGEATRIELGPLAATEARYLLTQLLTEIPDEDEQTRTAVLARAEGVPLYLVSCAQALYSGAMGQGAAEDVPWDIEESIRQRLAVLPEAARELINVAAVVGREASGRLLAQAAGYGARETIAALDAACRARLLQEDETGTFRFTHDVIWEVVVGDLGTTRRQLLHRHIAEALERDNSEQWLEALVYHYMRSDDREKALPYLERAATHALTQRAYGTATLFYGQQIEVLKQLGRTLDVARSREILGGALLVIAFHDDALKQLWHAAETYRQSGDIVSQARVIAQMGWVHARQGTPQDGLALLNPFLATLHLDTLPVRSLAELTIARGELEMVSCRYDELLRATEQAADYARAADDTALLAKTQMRRGLALYGLGRLEDARQTLEQAIALAEEARDGWSLCRAQNGLGTLYRAQGQFAEARRWGERARDVAEQQSDPTAISFMWYDLGETAFCQGEWQQARAAFEKAADVMRDLPPSWVSSYELLGAGRLNLFMGNYEMARRNLDEAVTRSGAFDELQVLRYAHAALAECELLDGQPASALARLEPLVDRDGQQELYVTMLLHVLAWACYDLGEVARAEDIAAQGIERARTQTYQLALTDALRVAAIIQIGLHHQRQARTLLDEALRVARAMSHPYAVAKALYAAGQLEDAHDEPEQARAHFTEALGICGQLGERLYATHIERAISELDNKRATH